MKTKGYNPVGASYHHCTLSQTMPMCKASNEQSIIYGPTAKWLTEAAQVQRDVGVYIPASVKCPPSLDRYSLEAIKLMFL